MLEKVIVIIALAFAIHKLANQGNETNLKAATEFIQCCTKLVSQATRFALVWILIELVNALPEINSLIKLFI